MNSSGERMNGYLIAQVRASKMPVEHTEESSDQNENNKKKPMAPLFFLDFNPKDNKFYQEMKASQNYPDLRFADTHIGQVILGSRSYPLKYNQQELIGFKFKKSNTKLISIILVLWNLDLLLLVYDMSNRKVVKRHYISLQEILNGLRLISWLQTSSIVYSYFHLNPYQNTLQFKITTDILAFNPQYNTHRVELKRLVSKGLDVSEIKEANNCLQCYRRSYLVEISDIFDPDKRTFNKGEWDSERYSLMNPQGFLIRSKVNKHRELSFPDIRGTEETVLKLDRHRVLFDDEQILAQHLYSTAILLCSARTAILVDKQTSKILDQRQLIRVLIESGKLSCHKNMILLNRGLYFTLLNWDTKKSDNQEEVQGLTAKAKAEAKGIKKVLDVKFYKRLPPLFGKILKVVDFRALDFDPNIYSILFQVERFLSEKKNLYVKELFHGLFDLRTKTFIHYSTAKEQKPGLDLEFSFGPSGDTSFRSQSRDVSKRSRLGSYYQEYLKLAFPKNSEELNQLLEQQTKGEEGRLKELRARTPRLTRPEPPLSIVFSLTRPSMKQVIFIKDISFWFMTLGRTA